MIYLVSAVDDPQGIKTEIEANSLQEATEKWAAKVSYSDDSPYRLQGWVDVRVCDAQDVELRTVRVHLKRD